MPQYLAEFVVIHPTKGVIATGNDIITNVPKLTKSVKEEARRAVLAGAIKQSGFQNLTVSFKSFTQLQ